MGLEFDVQLPRRDFKLNLQGSFGDETVGIYGPSGAGKTSLFSLLNGLEVPSRGHIILNDRILVDTEKNIFTPPYLRKIGVVFQEKLLFPNLTIRENLLFGTRYVNEMKLSLESVSELLNLSDFLDSMPYEISGGEQQRTAIGRALLTSPDLLLLDEPFNAVDSNLRLAILPFLKRLGSELDIPMLVISHDLPDIQKLTDNVYVIESGQCMGYGHVLDILSENSVLENAGMVNTFHLFNPVKSEDLYECSIKGVDNIKLRTSLAPEESFVLTVSPKEIAISHKYIENLSIQNQIKGRIIKMIPKSNGVLCLINGGLKLAAMVSNHSVHDLDLKTGDSVFCLFKAHSLRL